MAQPVKSGPAPAFQEPKSSMVTGRLSVVVKDMPKAPENQRLWRSSSLMGGSMPGSVGESSTPAKTESRKRS
jgi:hypothetical protein